MSPLITWLNACIDQDEQSIDTREHDSGVCDYLRGIHLEPERALAEIALKRKLIAEVAGMRHDYNDGDPWYSCSQAIDPHEDNAEAGSGCIDEERAGKPCDCGRDRRAARLLGIVAAVYSDRPGYAEAVNAP